jgi:hypothetical protein
MGEMDIWFHVFLTLALVGCWRSDSRPCHFTPLEKEPQVPTEQGCQSLSGLYGDVKILGNFSNRYSLMITLSFKLNYHKHNIDRLCGLVVKVLGYRSAGPGSIPGTTKKRSSGSGTGSTQPREHN